MKLTHITLTVAAAAVSALMSLSAEAAQNTQSGPGIWLPPVAKQEGFHITGIIDTGFRVQHTGGKTTLSMYQSGDETSGIQLRSREELGNGNYVRVKLAMNYKADTGEMQPGNNRLFNEAFLAVGGTWGELVAGRLSNIFSGQGDFGLCPQINPSSMGTNFWNSSLAPIFSSGYNFSNSVLYNSPRINGFHVAVQYSNGKYDQEYPKSKSDALANVALTYIGGPFKFAVIGGWYENDSLNVNGSELKDEKNITVMGSYWPGDGWSFHTAYQYVRDGARLGGSYFYYFTPASNGGMTTPIARSSRGVDAHAGIIAVGKRFGNQKVSAAFMANHVKYQGSSEVVGDRSGNRFSPAIIHRYWLSKRTHIWSAASMTYGTGIYKNAHNASADPLKTVDFGMGLVHHF